MRIKRRSGVGFYRQFVPQWSLFCSAAGFGSISTACRRSKSTASTSSTPVQAVPATFRGIAQSRNFLIGADSSISPLRNDVFYAQTLAHEYNFVGTGAETWWARVQKSRTEADFSNVDAIVEFATSNGMKVRGTALVSGDVPAWLSKANLSPAENSAIFKDFVQTMLRRYRGRVYSSGHFMGHFRQTSASRVRRFGRRISARITSSRSSHGHAKLIRKRNFSYTTITTPGRSRRGRSQPIISCGTSGRAEFQSMVSL